MKETLRNIGMFLFVALTLVLSPILLAVGLTHVLLRRRRLVRLAGGLECARCGEPLGRRALLLSDEEWDEHVAGARRAHPGERIRMVRRHDAICPNCGLHYRYDESERALVPYSFPPPEPGLV